MRQMKVIIAEDEPIVARYVSGILEQLGGFVIAAVCENGEEAIMQCRELSPQLLITDIKMPGISGLELIRQVQALGLGIRTIIISGFKSFDYAKQAIALGVEDYITKPIQSEELRSTLLRLKAEHLQALTMTYGEELERAMRNLDEAGFRSRFPYDRFRLLMIYQTEENGMPGLTLPQTEACASFFYRNVHFVLDAGQSAESEERMRQIYKAITLSEERSQTCAILQIRQVSASAETLHDLRRLHRVLREHTIPGEFVRLEYSTPQEIQKQTVWLDEELLKKLDLQTISKDWKAVFSTLRELFAFWQEHRYSLYRMKTGLHLITDQLQKAGAFPQGKLFVDEYLDDCIRCANHYGEIRDTVCSYLTELLQKDAAEQPDKKKGDQIYGQICKYVLRHEDQTFSLNEISRIFGVSQPFIRKLFRTNVGKSYNEWVQNMKIERAKELIYANPGMLIKDVAEKIGYEPLYFSTVFNKTVGMSPSDYKLQHQMKQPDNAE